MDNKTIDLDVSKQKYNISGSKLTIRQSTWEQVNKKTTDLGEGEHKDDQPWIRWTQRQLTLTQRQTGNKWTQRQHYSEKVNTKKTYLGAGGHKNNLPGSRWTQRQHTWEQVDTKLTAAS